MPLLDSLTPYFIRAANPYYGITAGTGDGSTAGTAAPFNSGTAAAVRAAIAANKRILFNAGGQGNAIDAGQTGGNNWWVMSALAPNLAQIGCWFPTDSEYTSAGLTPDNTPPYQHDGFRYDPPVTSGDGGWTHTGNGIWSKVFTTNGWALYYCRVTRNSRQGLHPALAPRVALRQCSGAAACLEAGDWYSGPGQADPVLYVNSGSTTLSPARVFDGLGIMFSGNLSEQTWLIDDSLATTAGQLETYDLTVLGALRIKTATAGGVVRDMHWENFQSWGGPRRQLYFAPTAKPNSYSAGIKRLRFVETYVDSMLRAESMQTEWADVGTGDLQPDLFSVYGQVSDVSLRNTVFKGWQHAAIEVFSDSNTTFGVTDGSGAQCDYPRNIDVYNDRPGMSRLVSEAPDTELSYGRFFTCYTWGALRIANHNIRFQNAQSQIKGTVTVEGNHWYDFRQSEFRGSGQNNMGDDTCLNLDADDGGNRYEAGCTRMLVRNNIIENCWNYPLWITMSYSNGVGNQTCFPLTAASWLVENNLIVDELYWNQRLQPSQTQVPGKPRDQYTAFPYGSIMVAAGYTNGPGGNAVTITQQNYRNNLVIRPNANVFVNSYTNPGPSGGVLLSGAVQNTAAILSTGTAQYTSLAAAGIDAATFKPLAGSPVIGAGIYTSPNRDMYGKLRPVSAAPDVGVAQA